MPLKKIACAAAWRIPACTCPRFASTARFRLPMIISSCQKRISTNPVSRDRVAVKVEGYRVIIGLEAWMWKSKVAAEAAVELRIYAHDSTRNYLRDHAHDLRPETIPE